MLAEANVRVTLEVVKFERDLRRQVQQAANRAGRDFDREMRSQMADTGKNATKGFADAARTTMGRAGRQAAQDFDVNFRNSLQQTGGKSAQRLSQLLRVQIGRAGIDAGKIFCENISGVLAGCGDRAARSFVGSLGQGLRGGATRAGKQAGDAIAANTERGAVRAGQQAGRQFSINFGVGSTRASRPLVAAFALAGSAILQSLRPATGILAAFPSLLFAVTASAVVTVSAFQGIGDAIKAITSGDIEKIDQAMRGLSPAARSFVAEFARARPQLQALRADIQDAFFGQLAGQITALAHTFSGPLRTSILDVASSAGVLGRTFTQAFTEAQGVSNLDATLRGTSRFLDQLVPGVRNLTRGFLDFAGAAAPGLTSVGRAISDLLTRIGQWLTQAARSGDALVWVEGGIRGLRELGGTLAEIGHVFLTVAAAARPLTFALSGATQIVFALAEAFGSLPGPIQTAILAAVLFSRSRLPEFLSRTRDEANPVTAAFRSMGEAYRTAADRAASYSVAASAVGRAVTASGRAVAGSVRSFGTAVDAVDRLAVATGRGLVQAATAVDTAMARTGQALQTGFIRASLEAEAAATRTSTALQTGIVRASLAVNAAFDSVGNAARRARDTLSSGLIPTALAIDSQFTRAQAAIGRFGAVLEGGVIRAADAAASGITTLGSSLRSGYTKALDTARDATTRMSNALHTGFLRATLAANDALSTFGTGMRNTVLRPLTEARSAYQTAASSVRSFQLAQSALNTTMGTAPTVLSRMREGLSGLTAVASGSGAALRSLASGPLEAMRSGMTTIGTGMVSFGGGLRNLGTIAAGAGGAITKGLGSALSGITGALGGPWGVAIAGAGIALSLLSGHQAEAEQAAAEHAAAISQLADTLNRQTGAVTQATFAMKSKELGDKGVIASARQLGISANDVTNAALGQADALDRVNNRLRSNVEGTIRGSGFYQKYGAQLQSVGVSMKDLSDVALGNEGATKKVTRAVLDNIDALGLTNADLQQYFGQLQNAAGGNKELADALGISTADLEKAQNAVRDQAAAMTPAQVAALRYADALGVLADNTADAETKARALQEALEILAGGTIDAEIAQGNFTDLLTELNSQLAESTKGLEGQGAAMITNTGRINTQTQAGAFLISTYSQLTSQLSTTAAATVEAGRANGNLDDALIQVAQQTQSARNQFIATATQLGLTEAQANQLADAYGLIPAQVLTTVTDQGSAQNVELQVAGVYDQLKDLPPNTPVTVTGLTQDAINKLNDVGLKTETLPDGKVRVTAETQEAKNSLQSLISSFSGKVINFVANVINGKAAGDIVANARGAIMGYASGNVRRLRNMPANKADIVPPNTWRIIGDRARNDEAYIPINTSGRSRALLAETARRMGFTLLADGALMSNNRFGAGVNIAEGAVVVNSPFADPVLVARQTVNELARAAAS